MIKKKAGNESINRVLSEVPKGNICYTKHARKNGRKKISKNDLQHCIQHSTEVKMG